MTTKKKETIMGGIKNFISRCPALESYLDALRELSVEYLDEDAGNYSISSQPGEPWVRKYVDGTGIRQYTIIFSSREAYSKDEVEALANCGFYEELTDWVENCNRERMFPALGDKKEVTRMTVITTPYVFDTTNTTAKYQVEIQFQYYQGI